MGNVLWKAFNTTGRIRTDERKCTWLVDQDSHSNFLGKFYMPFCLFSGLLDLIVLTQAWFERSSPPCTSSTKKLSLTIKTDYVIRDTRDVNQHWQLQAVWGENGLTLFLQDLPEDC